jgi:outer membrane protein OmpA-like peptidoglycan-associated protein
MKKAAFIYLLVSNFICAQNELKHEVYFNTNAYNVSEIEQNRLLLFIEDIENIAVEKISIYGFCDDRGSNAYNLTLSQQRADEIRSIFSRHSQFESLISNVDGKGEILLVVVETTDAHIIRGLNRKAEIIVTPKPVVDDIEEVVEVEEKDTPAILKGELEVGDKVLLENILFNTGNSDIIPESEETLEKIAQVLVEQDHLYFTIQGHVCCTKNSRDAVNSRTKKRNLSLIRAKYIYEYLAEKGVDKKRMKYVGMRRKFPLGGDPKYNRRVEILITYVGKSN